ncbi:MAG: type III secretion system stator protein SctL [Deltaproteobacteria bacterium]|nr:type III secretion system stator protein SctL [Deltaproteobacteria bacterium]
MEKEEKTNGPRLSNIISQAENIIEGAKTRADEIISEAEGIKDSAYKEGYDQGYADGMKFVAKNAVRLLADKTRINELIAQEATKLALAICRKIIGSEVQTRPERIKELALEVLSKTLTENEVVILVHVQDEKLMTESITEFEQVAKNVRIRVETNTSIEVGGCRIVTEFGEIDVTISALLDGIAERL